MAWFYVNKEWPKYIDHVDGDRKNNRISNLRSCKNQSQNCANSILTGRNKKRKYNLPRGVYMQSDKKSYMVRLRDSKNNKWIHVGSFKDLDEAEEAYKKKHKEIYKQFSPY